MSRLNPEKLHVRFDEGLDEAKRFIPRRYTLTHSDRTGELFLSIGKEYILKQISGLYTRLMRDEVLAELIEPGNKPELRVYCHVSGGLILGTAKWRYKIFRNELPLVMEAIRFGDRRIFEQHPDLDEAAVMIYYSSSNKRYNRREDWGAISKFKVENDRQER